MTDMPKGYASIREYQLTLRCNVALCKRLAKQKPQLALHYLEQAARTQSKLNSLQ